MSAAVKPLITKADTHFAAKEFEEAAELYTKAIKADEKSADIHEVYTKRSETYAQLKKYPESLSDAEIVVKLRPSLAMGAYRKGFALEKLMKLDEAKASYLIAQSLDAKLADVAPSIESVNRLLAEMKVTESEIAATTPKENPQKERFETIVKWCLDGGCRFPQLFIKYYDKEYRGVHANTTIPDETIILEVPLKMIMTSELAKESEICKKLVATGCRLRSTHSYLAAFLLEEKKYIAKSYWKSYIDILPVNFDSIPIFFGADELKYLKGSFVLEKIADRTEDLLLEYENICRCFPEFSKFSHKEFVWARLAVITRIFGLEINGLQTDGLVPMADMLNHKRPRETSWTFDNKRQSFTITALQALTRGDPVYDSYGPKCNSRFFVNYGFALEVNEENQCVIPVAIAVTDPFYALKVRYLGGYASSTRRRFQIPLQYAEKETREAFSFCRFAFADELELKQLGKEEEFKVDEIEPLSIKNEIAVLKELSRSAAAELKNFDTTVDEDTKLLNDPNNKPNWNIRNCLVMRRGEKRILHYYIGMAPACLPLYEKSWKELEPYVTQHHSSGKKDYDDYITTVIVPLVRAAAARQDVKSAATAAAPKSS